MNAIIVRPPPMVKAPTFRKYAPSSARFCGSGIVASPTVWAAVVSHHDIERIVAQMINAAAMISGVRG